MELRKLAIALAMVALPAVAHADEYGDSIRASFVRDISHQPAVTVYTPAIAEADPLDIVDAVLRGERSVGSLRTLVGSIS